MSKGNIIITGAGQRLGLALAKSLLKQGYHLIVSYRHLKPGIVELQQRGADCIQADFATNQGISSFIDSVLSQYNNIRAIIHNASDWHPENDNQPAADLMQQMMQVHVQAPYQINLAMSEALETYHAKNNQCADIIHLTDYIVEKGSHKHIAYAASKAALDNLTLSFASKLAPKVKVNSVAPSLLMFNEWDDNAYREKTMKKSLLGIVPGEQEGVEAIEFILNSRYFNGRTLNLDGGRHLK
ncbi:dihydromonapterin reductase [Thalassotalea maritima]|uniref:dihydromonapterin reductase n=1 Tax=Thalassotalea maritima TaxID=3242416 RepID=UPI0035287030